LTNDWEHDMVEIIENCCRAEYPPQRRTISKDGMHFYGFCEYEYEYEYEINFRYGSFNMSAATITPQRSFYEFF
jgi:hypothetical protein